MKAVTKMTSIQVFKGGKAVLPDHVKQEIQGLPSVVCCELFSKGRMQKRWTSLLSWKTLAMALPPLILNWTSFWLAVDHVNGVSQKPQGKTPERAMKKEAAAVTCFF